MLVAVVRTLPRLPTLTLTLTLTRRWHLDRCRCPRRLLLPEEEEEEERQAQQLDAHARSVNVEVQVRRGSLQHLTSVEVGRSSVVRSSGGSGRYGRVALAARACRLVQVCG